jgi:hypothetical protein
MTPLPLFGRYYRTKPPKKADAAASGNHPASNGSSSTGSPGANDRIEPRTQPADDRESVRRSDDG